MHSYANVSGYVLQLHLYVEVSSSTCACICSDEIRAVVLPINDDALEAAHNKVPRVYITRCLVCSFRSSP